MPRNSRRGTQVTTAKVWARPSEPRYVIQGRPWAWRDHGNPDEHGVALVLWPANLIQYLTPAQAIALADQLVDAAEKTLTKENNS
jgi:hypothetical protein